MKLHSDIHEARPTSIRDIIGQRSVVEQISVALRAARRDSRKFEHALFVGPPGTGKTAVSQVVAAEMGATFIEVLGQTLTGAADLNAVLMTVTDGTVLFVDEAHELPSAVQTALYLALDQRRISVRCGRNGSAPINVPVGDFSLLLATTDEYRLLQPLRERMRMVLRFDYYSFHALQRILRHRSQALGWIVEKGVFPRIARRSRGTPRLALRLLQAAHRVCRAAGEDRIGPGHLDEACRMEQLDGKGLGPTERQYLQILSEAPTRLNVIASRLGLPSQTISQVSEPFLIRAGLVEKDGQGRRLLTQGGRNHLRAQR